MKYKTTGIIFHTTPYSETSLIIQIYTRDFGLGSYIINNVRNKKSKIKLSLFQPLALVDLVVSGNAKGKLQRISEITLHYPYSSIPFNIIKSSITLFLNEILYKSIKEEQEDEELFGFIKDSLLKLDKEQADPDFHVYFMIALSRYLGFYPQGKYSSQTPVFDLQEGCFVSRVPVHAYHLSTPLSDLLYKFINVNEEEQLKIAREQRKQLLTGLITFYRLHVPSFSEIKSYSILEEVIA